MKFRAQDRDEPEINLIAFIDILLVILIFLMLTTTYNRLSEMQITLPTANADAPSQKPKEIVVGVAQDGRYAVNRVSLATPTVDALVSALGAAHRESPGAMLVISADASASHQSVVQVMEAARVVGLGNITFATQNRSKN